MWCGQRPRQRPPPRMRRQLSLDAPADVTATGSLVSWQAVTGATGYRLELRRAGAQVVVAETGAAGGGAVRYRLEELEAGRVLLSSASNETFIRTRP